MLLLLLLLRRGQPRPWRAAGGCRCHCRGGRCRGIQRRLPQLLLILLPHLLQRCQLLRADAACHKRRCGLLQARVLLSLLLLLLLLLDQLSQLRYSRCRKRGAAGQPPVPAAAPAARHRWGWGRCGDRRWQRRC